jgi:hypothetical protein
MRIESFRQGEVELMKYGFLFCVGFGDTPQANLPLIRNLAFLDSQQYLALWAKNPRIRRSRDELATC